MPKQGKSRRNYNLLLSKLHKQDSENRDMRNTDEPSLCVHGHVVFVEYVLNGVVFYSEGNAGGVTGSLKSKSLSQFKSQYSGLRGIIYLK